MTVVLGVDPGARNTGLVLMWSEVGELMSQRTVTDTTGLDIEYRRHILRAIKTFGVNLIAVENVVPPKGFRDGKRAPINPGSLIGTAAVLGLVTGFALEHGIRLQVVPPGGNGSGPLGSYPPALVSAAEKRGEGWESRQAGKGALCHVRSAWDVAVIGGRMAGVAA